MYINLWHVAGSFPIIRSRYALRCSKKFIFLNPHDIVYHSIDISTTFLPMAPKAGPSPRSIH